MTAQNGQSWTGIKGQFDVVIVPIIRVLPSRKVFMKDQSNTPVPGYEDNQDREDVLFESERYEKHKRTIAVLMGRYMLRYHLLLYEKFEGDLITPIILGEIAHHSISKFYHLEGGCLKLRGDAPAAAERLKHQEATNAYSISESTGIPRETVRRKIDKMVEKGWLEKGSKGEITITALVRDHFSDDFNKKLLTELLTTSTCITDLLYAD
ncbi:MAG: hypothetical protein N839_0005670 [Desulfofustis sp. PB-SRB1]|jgi:hypothetical protein|nr:hypothetical protein [Desulfofustis sp. PB-SRB1]MBM1001885.1 hypothetical protein [Desulfofustis sp. PB-SRB1]